MTFIQNKSCDKNIVTALIANKRCSPANSSVTSHNIQQHEKLFFEIVPCDSELNTDFTFFFLTSYLVHEVLANEDLLSIIQSLHTLKLSVLFFVHRQLKSSYEHSIC